MKKKIFFSILSLFFLLVLLFGCAPAAINENEMYQAPAAENYAEIPAAEAESSAAEPSVNEEVAPAEGISSDASSQDDLLVTSRRTDRLIIKNAEMNLLVEDTDTAIDRISQIVSDVDGYIVSSRVWYKDWGDESYKYSSITMGVPVDEFELALRRLRDISLKVLDENASGEDVTDEYVDLQSEVKNLEATRDRIRGFLDQAETVEEALRVNEELSQIEAQIAKVQGRINYLEDRSAYSTITISIEPDLPVLPTATPYPTITPWPTATPEPWIPSETLKSASNSLKNIYQTLVEMTIWILVVIVPVITPPILVIWLLWKYVFRKRKGTKKENPPE